MKPIRSLPVILSSHRTYLGYLLGMALWLLIGLLFGWFGGGELGLSLLLTLWVAGAWEPKKAAALGVLMGLPVGIFYMIRAFANVPAPATAAQGVVYLMFALLVTPLGATLGGAINAFEAMVFATWVKMCRHGVIF